MGLSRSKLFFIILAAIILVLVARECYIRSRINWINARIDSIKVGMTEADVIRIMGGPGHLEEKANIPIDKRSKAQLIGIKRSYMLLWYRSILGTGNSTYVAVEFFFDQEKRQVLEIQKILWNF